MRTVTQLPDNPKMWRRLVACAHPDAGGDHELFVWVTTVKEAVCGGIEERGLGEPAEAGS